MAGMENPKDYQEVGHYGGRIHIARRGSRKTLCGRTLRQDDYRGPLHWIARVGCRVCRRKYGAAIPSVADWDRLPEERKNV